MLKVDAINALSFTGGTLYIYKGLVEFLDAEMQGSDDAFAAVIAHELVHLDRRHGLDMLDLAGGSKQLLTSKTLNVRSLNHLMKGVSRKHEFEADLIGSLYTYRAGFDPAAAYRFHRRMIATGHEVSAGLDHPTHAERAARLREYLLGLRAKARQFELGLKELERHNYDLAVRHLEIYLGLFPGSLAARNNLGVALHRRALQIAKSNHAYKLSTDIDPDKRIPSIRLRSRSDRAKDFRPDRSLMIEAVELFQGTVLRDPSYLPAQNNLGASLLAWVVRAKRSRSLNRYCGPRPTQPRPAPTWRWPWQPPATGRGPSKLSNQCSQANLASPTPTTTWLGPVSRRARRKRPGSTTRPT